MMLKKKRRTAEKEFFAAVLDCDERCAERLCNQLKTLERKIGKTNTGIDK